MSGQKPWPVIDPDDPRWQPGYYDDPRTKQAKSGATCGAETKNGTPCGAGVVVEGTRCYLHCRRCQHVPFDPRPHVGWKTRLASHETHKWVCCSEATP